jgi:hypothetical protein
MHKLEGLAGLSLGLLLLIIALSFGIAATTSGKTGDVSGLSGEPATLDRASGQTGDRPADDRVAVGSLTAGAADDDVQAQDGLERRTRTRTRTRDRGRGGDDAAPVAAPAAQPVVDDRGSGEIEPGDDSGGRGRGRGRGGDDSGGDDG